MKDKKLRINRHDSLCLWVFLVSLLFFLGSLIFMLINFRAYSELMGVDYSGRSLPGTTVLLLTGFFGMYDSFLVSNIVSVIVMFISYKRIKKSKRNQIGYLLILPSLMLIYSNYKLNSIISGASYGVGKGSDIYSQYEATLRAILNHMDTVLVTSISLLLLGVCLGVTVCRELQYKWRLRNGL